MFSAIIEVKSCHFCYSISILLPAVNFLLHIFLFSVTVYNIKHNYTEHGIFNFDVDNFPSSLTTNLTKLKKVQDEVKIWTLLIGDYVILSSNEMESQRVAKVCYCQ